MRRRPTPWLCACLIAAALAASACGSSLRKQQAQRLAEADALFARACYSCLTRAFQIYDSLRLAGYQPALTTARAFDAAILLAMREKDLAMPADPWLAKAEGLQPPAAATAASARAALYLDMARKARWSVGRLDQDQAGRFEGRTAAEAISSLPKWEAALGPPAARDLVGTYLMAALACAYTPPSQQQARLTLERLAPAHRQAPLMKYAIGTCDRGEFRKELDALASDPDFSELLYQNGRLRMFRGGPTMYLDAKVLLEAARAAMPDNVANTHLLAGVHRALQEFTDCAARYDEVIARGGARRDSMLYRTECLTRAPLRERAIESATELIDSPGIHRGEAFYHRAWNRYHLKQLPAARTDVDEAKRLWVNADVLVLSGFIAYDMDQKDFAYTEFGAGLMMNSEYCVAGFYQGLIDSARERWAQAADKYEKATYCYSRSVSGLTAQLKNAEDLPADDPTRGRRIDNLTEGLNAEKLQLARAAYNTAYSFGQSGSPAKGIPFAEQSAAAHKDMEKLAKDLLEILKKAGGL